MGSVGITEEEGKFNNPVTAPHTIPYYYFPPNLLVQVSNKATKSSPVIENDVIGANNYGSIYTLQRDKGSK